MAATDWVRLANLLHPRKAEKLLQCMEFFHHSQNQYPALWKTITEILSRPPQSPAALLDMLRTKFKNPDKPSLAEILLILGADRGLFYIVPLLSPRFANGEQLALYDYGVDPLSPYVFDLPVVPSYEDRMIVVIRYHALEEKKKWVSIFPTLKGPAPSRVDWARFFAGSDQSSTCDTAVTVSTGRQGIVSVVDSVGEIEHAPAVGCKGDIEMVDAPVTHTVNTPISRVKNTLVSRSMNVAAPLPGQSNTKAPALEQLHSSGTPQSIVGVTGISSRSTSQAKAGNKRGAKGQSSSNASKRTKKADSATFSDQSPFLNLDFEPEMPSCGWRWPCPAPHPLKNGTKALPGEGHVNPNNQNDYTSYSAELSQYSEASLPFVMSLIEANLDGVNKRAKEQKLQELYPSFPERICSKAPAWFLVLLIIFYPGCKPNEIRSRMHRNERPIQSAFSNRMQRYREKSGMLPPTWIRSNSGNSSRDQLIFDTLPNENKKFNVNLLFELKRFTDGSLRICRANVKNSTAVRHPAPYPDGDYHTKRSRFVDIQAKLDDSNNRKKDGQSLKKFFEEQYRIKKAAAQLRASQTSRALQGPTISWVAASSSAPPANDLPNDGEDSDDNYYGSNSYVLEDDSIDCEEIYE